MAITVDYTEQLIYACVAYVAEKDCIKEALLELPNDASIFDSIHMSKITNLKDAVEVLEQQLYERMVE